MAQPLAEPDIICKLIMQKPLGLFAPPKYFSFFKSFKFGPFKCLLEAESGHRCTSFHFIDIYREDIAVTTDEDFEIFKLWVEEMRDAGKALEVNVKVQIP